MAKRPRSFDTIANDLRIVAGDLAEAEAVVERLRARRLALWREGRALGPDVTFTALGQASNVDGNYVNVAMTRAAARETS